MAYLKLIRSGKLIESYEYQFEPPYDMLEKARKARNPRIVKRPRTKKNAASARRNFHRLVRSNLDPNNPPVLLTLTFKENISQFEEANKLFTRFMQKLIRDFGKVFSYIAVPEFQKRGAIHYHVLMFNFPYEYSDERKTRKIANMWGHGFVDFAPTDGSPKLATYLAKYMSKAFLDPRLMGKRAYFASRNVLRPVSVSNNFKIAFDFITEEWGLDGQPVDNSVVRERVYDTKWLGRCVYKQIILEK